MWKRLRGAPEPVASLGDLHALLLQALRGPGQPGASESAPVLPGSDRPLPMPVQRVCTWGYMASSIGKHLYVQAMAHCICAGHCDVPGHVFADAGDAALALACLLALQAGGSAVDEEELLRGLSFAASRSVLLLRMFASGLQVREQH